MPGVWVCPSEIKKNPKQFLRYCVLFEKLVFNIIQWHYNYIRKRSHDDVAFAEFDRSPNFVPDDILPDVVSRLGSHENYNPCRMDFVRDEITNSLMEQ
jgi:hypothetical protein